MIELLPQTGCNFRREIFQMAPRRRSTGGASKGEAAAASPVAKPEDSHDAPSIRLCSSQGWDDVLQAAKRLQDAKQWLHAGMRAKIKRLL